MIIIIEYQCTICRKKYSTEAQALECEARGVADPKRYPIGQMYEYHHNGYVGIFATAEVVPHFNSHLVDRHSWACRVQGYPRYSFDHVCGSDLLATDEESWKNWLQYHILTLKRKGTPEYNEMVEFLKKEKKLKPFYYDANFKKHFA